jgi:hypothetical protein
MRPYIIRTLIQMLQEKELVLPAMQRPFVWAGGPYPSADGQPIAEVSPGNDFGVVHSGCAEVSGIP